ncbi:hypothetical protein [uncultured Maribacter sp.]|uniref:hypothetical protein n=1 Tax=uncultured Maribacter sp. TaxID=431308 RepID=UPI00261A8930|nr:hypothetical protein [uncultured Maribacter sp.]
MKKQFFKTMMSLSICLVVSFLLGCGPAKMSSTWTKDTYKEKKYSKIAIIGISNDLLAKNTFEQDAVKLLKKQGINAVEGIKMFPLGADKNKTAEDYIKIIKENNLDGVITMALIDSKEKDRYVPGEALHIPTYYRVGKYIVRSYQTIDTPGYYTTSKSFLIEAILYDVKGDLYKGKETMVWTGQSTLLEPYSLKNASESFTKIMVDQLIKDEIIVSE